MNKILLSIMFLLVTFSHAGMFDQVKNMISNELSKTSENDLISSISKNMNITPTQATTGTATILQYAKNQISDTDYTGLLKDVPALGNLNTSSLTDSLLNKISSAESVQTAFKTLGMDSNMVSKFVPLIIEYVQKVGGVDSSTLLTSALKGLL
ncbi:DUF2780 domain-containing protein [Arcobacter sp.]|uniref:DUF2780 domain-containing protein n=2 Tax=Arcobacter TaxID=28196 RepID=UPI003B002560